MDNLDVEESENVDMDDNDDEYSPLADLDDREEVVYDSEDTPEWKKIKFCGGTVGVSPRRVNEALAFYRSSSKGTRTIESMHSKFRFLETRKDIEILRKFEIDGEEAVRRRSDALRGLAALLYDWIIAKMGEHVTLHDVDLQRAAIMINREHTIVDNFKASKTWIQKFKRAHRLCSRKVTKFISKSVMQRAPQIRQAGQDFVTDVNALIRQKRLPLFDIVNCDQSGIQRELVSGRTLATVGEKSVHRIVGNVSATTHSTTVMPILRADGTVEAKLFVVLQERDGRLPSNPYKADNLVVKANRTHIMTQGLMLEWLELCVRPVIRRKTLVLLDHWPSFKRHDLIEDTLRGKEVIIRNIPPSTTGQVQPLDVHYFRYFKSYIRKITGFVLVNEVDFPVHQRDSILKILSVVHYQFCAIASSPSSCMLSIKPATMFQGNLMSLAR